MNWMSPFVKSPPGEWMPHALLKAAVLAKKLQAHNDAKPEANRQEKIHAYLQWNGESIHVYPEDDVRQQASALWNRYEKELPPNFHIQREVEAPVGSHIKDVLVDACHEADRTGLDLFVQFNDVTIPVTPGLDPEELHELYHRLQDAKAQAYLESDEYKEACREREEKKRREQEELQLALTLSPARPRIYRRKWKKGIAAQKGEEYGLAVYRYALLWARLMEGRLKLGESVADCADQCSRTADVEGITGFMYGAAVAVLANCWFRGEELRVWHNAQYLREGEEDKGGVVNPAVLTLSV